MSWPALVLSLMAFLASQTSSHPPLDVSSLLQDYPAEPLAPHHSPDIQKTLDEKRALTLLSRLAPIRNAFRPHGSEDDRHFDSRAFRARWNNINERAPAGPLRWGRR